MYATSNQATIPIKLEGELLKLNIVCSKVHSRKHLT